MIRATVRGAGGQHVAAFHHRARNTKVGTFDSRQLKEAAIKSNEALKQLGTDIQWVESYISEDKIFCVYLAANEELIREHASESGFPANKITAIRRRIDPTTAYSSVGPVPLGHV